MKCHHCGINEAENHMVINWLGMEHNLHLCNECKEKLSKHYMGAISGQRGYNKDKKVRTLGQSPFPSDAGDSIRQRRKLNALRGRLNEAIAMEQYEVAARLRDEITHIEKEVHV